MNYDFTNFLVLYAATYNCDTYGAGAYNNNEACTTTTGGNDGGNNGGNDGGNLSNTGQDVMFAGVAAGLLLLVAGAVMLMRLRRNKAKV